MKTLRLYIVKPLSNEDTWKDVGGYLRDLQYKSAKLMNFFMAEWYLWQREKEKWKERNGKYPTFAELPDPGKWLYAEGRKLCPEMSSSMAGMITQRTKLKWKSDCKDIFYRQNKTLPTFKKTGPLHIHNQAYKVTKTDFGYILHTTLFSREVDHKKRFEFVLNTHKINKSQKDIIENILSGNYKRGSLQIGFNDRKKKWFANIAYEPTKKELFLNPDKIIGIDLGITNAFYCALSNSMKRLSADGHEVLKFRENIKRRRISISRQGPFSTRKGRGRKNILDPVRKLSEKERRFRDTKYHCYTREIIDFAVKNQAGVLQLEDLDSLKQNKASKGILKDWSIFDFQTKLEYKAKEVGIEIKYVNPQYTSQRCYKCGCIDSNNRPDQKTFKCCVCEHKANADYNAAQNLSMANIDKVIEDQLAAQEALEVRAS